VDALLAHEASSAARVLVRQADHHLAATTIQTGLVVMALTVEIT
jgi:hypothetical protein